MLGTLSKVLERILLSELVLKCKVGEHQFGFRKRMGCAFVPRLMNKIMAKARARNLLLFFCSVDIFSAFDSVVHSKLFLTHLD